MKIAITRNYKLYIYLLQIVLMQKEEILVRSK